MQQSPIATRLTIVMAQLNLLVGDIDGNTTQVIKAAQQARDRWQAHLIVFPELTLCGYPPEDLLLRPSLLPRIEQARQRLQAVTGIDLIIGLPAQGERGLENRAVVLRAGQIICHYAKQQLPNYQVFDEQRYFTPGNQVGLFDCHGVSVALAICEDLWVAQPAQQAKAAGAQLLISLNASPFHYRQQYRRRATVRQRCRETGLPIVYVNLYGGQDELVFDGGSLAMNPNGKMAVAADYFAAGLYPVHFEVSAGVFIEYQQPIPLPVCAERIYQALVMGVRDYVNKNGFSGVLLGLSGGIDSALVLTIAVDALGAERVQAVMMPSRYTAPISLDDAQALARTLGVSYQELSIEPALTALLATLEYDMPANGDRDTTVENLQARCRGILLMALANQTGDLVLTTGNKSELAVGYATLYGDMVGGYNPLKDVLKTQVYQLAAYRNRLQPVIPQRILERPPSAELAPDQVDTDRLPPYTVLDSILTCYIEADCSAEAIVAKGFDRNTVYRILRWVDANEFKRRQAAIGIRITPRGFGRDRRYPVTQGWQLGI